MTVERIFTRPTSGGQLLENIQVKVIAGAGIEGDWNFGKRNHPGQNITLIEAEEIETFLKFHARPYDLSVTHRNVVTRGVRLNALVGQEFSIGTVLFRGVELCEPCLRLGELLQSEELSAPRAVRYWAHRAGLRANALTTGEIALGFDVRMGVA